MKDVLTVTFDSENDKSALCVSREYREKTIILKLIKQFQDMKIIIHGKKNLLNGYVIELIGVINGNI